MSSDHSPSDESQIASRRRRVSRPARERSGGHGHSHTHSLSEVSADLPPLARRVVVVALSVIGIAVIAGMVLLWPSGGDHPIPAQFRGSDGGTIHTVDGKVVSQTRADCLNQVVGTVQDTADIPISGAGTGPCIESVVSISSGNHAGKYTLLEVPTNAAQSGTGPDSAAQSLGAPDDPQPGQPTLSVGDSIRMSSAPGADGQPRYAFFDFGRTNATIIWAILFAASIILVAAWRGLRSLIGLVFAFAILGIFTLPAILDGESPVAVAVVSSAAILFVVLYLAHGVSLRTSSALLGTLTSLGLAGALSWLSIKTMHLTGLSGDQTTSLQVYQGSISISGLLLAGFIIGTLGVLNDVTITQASAAFELAAAGQPSRLGTFRAAMRVGRDHIASTVYTLVFAYAGSALPLLLLFSVAKQPIGSLLTTDIVGVELARSFVGGIAIALSVPLTTAIAAALTRPGGASRRTPQPAAPALAEKPAALERAATPVRDAPSRERPVRETPVRETPVRETPVRETPVREMPVRETPARDTPARDTPVRETPARERPARESPFRDTPSRERPVRDAPTRDTPIRDTPARDTPARETLRPSGPGSSPTTAPRQGRHSMPDPNAT